MRVKKTMQKYPQYSSKQKTIHWLSALLVVIVVALLICKVTLSQVLGGMANIYLWHKSLGVVVFLFTVWRVIVISKDGVPDVLPKNKKLQRILAKSTQGFLYILLFILPLSGYLMSSRALNVFGLISIPAIPLPNGVYGFFHSIHIVGSYLLAILVMFHIAGALYHYFWVKDKALQSML